MNILLTKFPKKIKIGKKYYSIDSDFRTWIRFESEFLKSDDNKKKLELIFAVLEEAPVLKNVNDFSEAVNAIVDFYNCGKALSSTSSASASKTIYSFDTDQFHIYTDFLQFYNIDLNEVEYMHWWKFRQLFIELPEKSKIKTIMMYRSIQITSKMPSEHRQFYARMKQLYSLEDSRNPEDKVKSAGSVLAGHMKINK